MKTTMFRAFTATFGLVFATMLAPTASAGCGNTAERQTAHQFVPVADHDSDFDRDPIVGLWKVTFTSKHSQGVPDGAVIDWGYSQWHSDGTEILNSGSRAPATQNFCLGVWKKTGFSTYKLNHVALSYDATTGTLNGTVNIREEVTVSRRGDRHTGAFTIDVFDPAGHMVAHLAGEITGERVTAD